MYSFICICICICISRCTCMYIYMYICIYIYMCVCVDMCDVARSSVLQLGHLVVVVRKHTPTSKMCMSGAQ